MRLKTLACQTLIFLLIFSSLAMGPIMAGAASSASAMGWGGRLSGGIPEFEKYLSLMKRDGWNAIRLYGNPPWWDMEVYSQVELDYIVRRCQELQIRLFLDLMHNYPAGDYVSGHEQELIDYWIRIGKRYSNATAILVLEIVNEWLPSSPSVGYATFQRIVTALRDVGLKHVLLLNYHAADMTFDHLVNDPLNATWYGRHYYGNRYDETGLGSKLPLKLDEFANKTGITASVEDLFKNGDAAKLRAKGKVFCVTELGASYTPSNEWMPGGYVYSPGGIAFVHKFLDAAAKYGGTCVTLHRIGDHYQGDYQVYMNLSRSYFNEALDNPIKTGSTQANAAIGAAIILLVFLLILGTALIIR
jgi:hypothetical protein